MKKLKAILSVALIGILIFATAGFSVSRHYCMGMLVTENFFEWPIHNEDDEYLHCENMEDHHSGMDSLLKSCCEDEVIFISGIDVQSFSKESLALSVNLLTSFIYTAPQVSLKELPISLTCSLPPPEPEIRSGTEILVWVQRFLI